MVSKIVWQGIATVAIVALAVSVVLEVTLTPGRIQYVTQSVTLIQTVTQQIGTTTDPNAYLLVRFEYEAYGPCLDVTCAFHAFGCGIVMEVHFRSELNPTFRVLPIQVSYGS